MATSGTVWEKAMKGSATAASRVSDHDSERQRDGYGQAGAQQGCGQGWPGITPSDTGSQPANDPGEHIDRVRQQNGGGDCGQGPPDEHEESCSHEWRQDARGQGNRPGAGGIRRPDSCAGRETASSRLVLGQNPGPSSARGARTALTLVAA